MHQIYRVFLVRSCAIGEGHLEPLSDHFLRFLRPPSPILAIKPLTVYKSPMDLVKKLNYQSWHRGTRENDLLLGRFADAVLPTLSTADLKAYEVVLCHEDADLFAWITGQQPIPDNDPLICRIREFYQCRS